MSSALPNHGDTPLAAVDLGSNSFRLLIARQEGGQMVAISGHREGVRLAGGLDADHQVSAEKMDEACAALSRFRERLAGIPPARVRAVATSTYRVARNANALLRRSEAALGRPIDILSGAEEARLIYIGCAHTLPWSDDERLIVDIGGGSTEFIVGRGYTPELTESFPLGAVTLSRQFFPDGVVTAAAFRKADVFVRSRLEVLPAPFRVGWATAWGSSGSIHALWEIVRDNQLGPAITLDTLLGLRARLIDAADMSRVSLAALKSNRAPVLPGGLAILLGLMQVLQIRKVEPAEGALRLGVLYDLLQRGEADPANDPRSITVARLQARYGADRDQVRRVGTCAAHLWQSAGAGGADALLAWAAALHEIGMAIAHEDYHRHSAYILSHADLYGFSEQERAALGELVLGHTGSLKKIDLTALSPAALTRLVCLRFAALFCHGRADTEPPARLRVNDDAISLTLGTTWLAERPLTAHLLEMESTRWRKAGMEFHLIER